MKIAKLQAREVFDAQGIATIECEIILQDGSSFSTALPSDIYSSPYAAHVMRDGGSRLNGLGVEKAIEIIESDIAPLLLKRVPDVVTMDQEMIQADATENKRNFGANSMLVVSMTVLKAQAYISELDIFGLIAKLFDADTAMLPVPAVRVLSKNLNASASSSLITCLLIPVRARNFKSSMEQSIELFYQLQVKYNKQNIPQVFSSNGNLLIDMPLVQMFDFVMEVVKENFTQQDFKFVIDMQAHSFYQQNTQNYLLNGKLLTSAQLIEYYQQLCKQYPIAAFIDPANYDDIDLWQAITQDLGQERQIIGGNIFASDAQRIYEGVNSGLANAARIKPSDVGTMSEVIQAVQVCQEYNAPALISASARETSDTLLADLAVGTSVGQIDIGGLRGGEHMIKYNRLLAIEDQLALSLLED